MTEGSGFSALIRGWWWLISDRQDIERVSNWSKTGGRWEQKGRSQWTWIKLIQWHRSIINFCEHKQELNRTVHPKFKFHALTPSPICRWRLFCNPHNPSVVSRMERTPHRANTKETKSGYALKCEKKQSKTYHISILLVWCEPSV